MATAQQMPAGPRSARLADDAATAALYATHLRRKAPVRDATTADSQYLNQRVTGATPNLSHASAGAALAHANRKSVEIWRPGRLTDAEKAAFCVKDFTPPQFPQPSTQYSAEGLGAAILAVREQRGMTSLPPTQTGHKHDISIDQSEAQAKALRAATGAYTTRQRAGSAPSEPVVASDSPYARSAAGASGRVRVEAENPLDHLDSAMEASRIHHVANADARLYSSSPPVASEIEERNRKNSLRAAAISMAKDMYDVTGPRGESGDLDPAIYAAQRGQEQSRARKTVGGVDRTTGQRAMTLQDAAQKRAAEKLARMQDEHAGLQEYYGTAPQPQRSRLTSRRKRTSSEADATDVDAERSRQIRNQMFSLRTKLNRVDEQRQKDRDMLMEAARRNVDVTMQNMDKRMYADTGRAPPSIQKEWDEAAQARVRKEAELAEASGARGNRVNIGAEQYMDMADIEAVARTRVQPALDEITDQADQRRAQELEARLDAEEQQRKAAIEREREAEMKAVEKQDKRPEKRESKGVNLFLLRRMSKLVRPKKPEPEKEATAAQQAAAPETAVEKAPTQEPPIQEAPTEEAPVTKEAAAAPEVRAPSREATAQEAPEEPEAAGAATGFAAAPIAAPVRIVSEPTEGAEHPGMVRPDSAQRDAAAIGGSGVSAMHTIRPITSPRADSKLKSWFRDRLVRRSSGPVPVYPHQPGPDFNTESEVGFTGGATLTGRNEPRGAALSSHPVTGADLDSNGNSFETAKTTSERSASSLQGEQNGNGKRQRLRRSFLKTVTRGSPGSKTNGATHSQQGPEGSDVQNLRNSAVEQGLPVPPVIGEPVSTRRESRFSEDL